ncbi:AAA family ATPase, partial [Steroidobacter sp.]|uniref:AAA family ATPase n=1 Tax=Steroidobacter sp. TaxID=1978227 RepID=UPI001A45B332
MAAHPIIEKLGRIKDLGMFRDCSASEQPRFRRYNLIYGFNGSGKTTLSRLFASLGAGSRAATLPEEGTFEVHLTDGSLQACPDRLGALSGRILVFNTDFIEDSFYWNQGEARPVFYIGKEQAELAQELALATEEAVALQSRLEVASVAASSAERAFALYKRTVARDISEQTGLGRKYDASNLVRDYSSPPLSGYSELGEAELSKSREMLSQAAPMPKLPSIELSPEDMRQLVLRGCHLLKVSPAEIVLADLREHGDMRQWVGEGLRYHDDHELSSCLFCGNRLSNERKRSLHEVIDGAFEALIMNLKRSKIEVVECSARLRAIELALPRIS